MRLFGLFLLVLGFIGCRKEKLQSPEAFFIKTGSASVSTVATQGTSSSKITDLWLYVDGNFKGAYPVGNTLPIPSSEGNARVTIYAGIKNNGISATRLPYEFYQPIEIDTNVKSGTTVNRNFNFTYKSAAKFAFIESFEGGTQGINMAASIDSDLSSFMIDNTSASFEGGCMKFSLDTAYQFARFQSTYQFPLPIYGGPAFLELNYKCDQAFEVGVVSGVNFKRAAFVNASPEWNKIYILLSTAAGAQPTSTNQGFYLKAVRDPNISNPRFYIDNIKIITY